MKVAHNQAQDDVPSEVKYNHHTLTAVAEGVQNETPDNRDESSPIDPPSKPIASREADTDIASTTSAEPVKDTKPVVDPTAKGEGDSIKTPDNEDKKATDTTEKPISSRSTQNTAPVNTKQVEERPEIPAYQVKILEDLQRRASESHTGLSVPFDRRGMRSRQPPAIAFESGPAQLTSKTPPILYGEDQTVERNNYRSKFVRELYKLACEDSVDYEYRAFSCSEAISIHNELDSMNEPLLSVSSADAFLEISMKIYSSDNGESIKDKIGKLKQLTQLIKNGEVNLYDTDCDEDLSDWNKFLSGLDRN